MECARFQISVLRKRVVSLHLAYFSERANGLYFLGDIYQNNENMSMQGSIFWMAPEGKRAFLSFFCGASSLTPRPQTTVIHNNKQGYSAKADIWSLGCICIEMLAGSRPWEGEGFMGAMFKVSPGYSSYLAK
jgi:serine/threonine protein kinase